MVSETHNSKDYISFLKILDAKYPKEDKIRLVLDNLRVHTSEETRKYLATVPERFEFVFTPKHGSWLNMVEGFFSKMTKQMLRGIRVKSKEDVLSDEIVRPKAVIIEFIGGEPLLEAELISDIVDYFKIETYKRDDDWFWNYRINICTNGVNYSDQKVQDILMRNGNKMSISITVDGTKEKHDLQRVFPDGSGSYDAINNNIGLYTELSVWIEDFLNKIGLHYGAIGK